MSDGALGVRSPTRGGLPAHLKQIRAPPVEAVSDQLGAAEFVQPVVLAALLNVSQIALRYRERMRELTRGDVREHHEAREERRH